MAALPFLLPVSDVSDSILFASAVNGNRTGDLEGSANPEFVAMVAAVKEEVEMEKKFYAEDEDGPYERILG